MKRFGRGTVLVLASLSAGVARADVVPPRAVEVAEGWLALVDRGDGAAAVEKYFDPRESRSAHALTARLAASSGRALQVKDRTIRSWTGHGTGDSVRMAPGSSFSLVFDTTYVSGRSGTDEIRMVPKGGDWRVVGYECQP